MHRNYWDVEVYAKDMQQRRWQEAVRQRRIDEAMGGAVNPFDLGVARLVLAAKAWFRSGFGARAAGLGEQASASSAVAERVPGFGRPRPSPSRSGQPYDDMLVIARAPAVRATEESRVGSDC